MLMLAIAATASLAGGPARGQVGQTALDPAGGLVNQAASSLLGFEAGGDRPGWLYYGINAADRGLGYNGSYMTLGGFIPYAEDDLGGFWAADLRSHLSVYGGFFSNVGAVRKQFIGGTLLGVGVYWDYDGDMNQYPVAGVPGTSQFGQFGHAYNQVGVSGEWLTNYGNLRTNGYMPVGTTANTLGAPGSPFTGNFLLCQTGLDAALGGADLEVGAYIPGLADWAGMISVGGYALGNSSYQWSEGSQFGQDVVPWFGGVYTRLDMTFLENWDFSLQANNDSYFDWTGFARLTYRMGGSRRRNVPDQVEQPMMRNEHIVRGHQTPIVAINPVTGQPWNVIHVDNSVMPGGDGTAEAPLSSLALAQTRATQPYDVVFVHAGNSAIAPYESNWQFQADNQLLVGQGSTLELNTSTCGYRSFFDGTPGARPRLTSNGTAVTLRNGAIVDHFRIQDAPIGIAADASLTGTATVNDVQLVGTGVTGDQGIVLTGLQPGSKVNLYNMQLTNMDLGLFVDGGAGDVDFQGMISNTASSNASLLIQDTTGGTINVNDTANFLETPYARNARFTVPFGIMDDASQFSSPITIQRIQNNTVVNVSQASVSGAAGIGVQVTQITNSSVTFSSLQVTEAGDQAFFVSNGDNLSLITIDGASRLSSASTTLPAFQSSDNAGLKVTLTSLESAVPNATGQAIVLNGTSTGFLTVSESFLVGGAPGTEANNVTNGTGTPPTVVVTVPTP
jgi:hypothetical protein